MMKKEKKKIFKECKWHLDYNDNRRNDPTVSEMQKEIAEKWFQVYSKLYAEMKKELEREVK